MTMFEGNDLPDLADRLAVSFITREEQLYAPSWWNATAVTGAATASYGDVVFTCNTSAGPYSISLPSAADSLGKLYVVKKTDSSAFSVSITPSDSTIEGGHAIVFSTQYNTVGVHCDGTQWWILWGLGTYTRVPAYGALWSLVWTGYGQGYPGALANRQRVMGRGKQYLFGQSFGGR